MTPNYTGGESYLTDSAYEHYTRMEYLALTRTSYVWYTKPEPTTYAKTNTSPLREWPIPSREDARALVALWSNYYGIDPSWSSRIVNCESGFNAKAKNKGSSAAGLWQFIRSTFNSTARRMGHEDWTYEEYVWNATVNAQMGAWLAAADGPGHWECK